MAKLSSIGLDIVNACSSCTAMGFSLVGADRLPRVPNYTLGPEDGILSVRTSRTGAVAKAGHDLLIHVTEWSATLDTDAPSLTLDAEATSLRVREGTGGMKALDDDDLANIETTIDDEVLLRRDISFRSTSVSADGDALAVTGDLTLVGTDAPDLLRPRARRRPRHAASPSSSRPTGA